MKFLFHALISLSLLACTSSDRTEQSDAISTDEISTEETPVLVSDENATSDQQKGPIVYVTNEGDKYHTADCRYSKTAHEVKLSQAKADGKTACGICKPNSTTGEKQARCSANTADGSRCKRLTSDSSGKCFQHRI